MCLISVFAIYMCMPVWTCLINSYNLYLSFKQNACFTDLFLVCITFERISTQHVEGHDGRSLSSHCWRMEPATGDWQAWLREWQWFQDCSSNVLIPWTWLGFISACKQCAKMCEVQPLRELEVGFVCLCRSGFVWKPIAYPMLPSRWHGLNMLWTSGRVE